MKTKYFLAKLGINSLLKGKISNIQINSYNITENSVFIALKGKNFDANDYVDDKLLNKVSVVLTEKNEILHPKIIKIENLKYRLSQIVNIFYPDLFKNIVIIGVCGTCGKTTTATMIYEIIKNNNDKVIYFGTGMIKYDDKTIITDNTTLNSIDFVNTYISLKYKPKYIVLEVSSHAILEKRCDFLKFNYLIFTNFSQDHLDYHLNMKNYFDVKKSLFKTNYGTAIINLDDNKSTKIIEQTNMNIITYGLFNGYYTLKNYNNDNVLSYNKYNMLAAYSLASELKIDKNLIKETLNNYQFNLGRSQIVYNKKFKTIIDYAHTPSSFETILNSITQLSYNKLIVVFGCGGNRDVSKRKIIGQIVKKYADIIVITNDNPRYENPNKIVNDIKKGCNPDYVILDRKKAIEHSVSLLKENDVLLVLGKGIEPYQLINGKKIPFNDLNVILESVKVHE